MKKKSEKYESSALEQKVKLFEDLGFKFIKNKKVWIMYINGFGTKELYIDISQKVFLEMPNEKLLHYFILCHLVKFRTHKDSL